MMDRKSDLELQADEILKTTLNDKKRNKTRTDEYPILSDSQLKRRRSKEIPISSLSRKQSHQVDNSEGSEE